VDVDHSLDIFEIVAITSEPSKKIIKRELLIFKHYQMDGKEITCPLRWWEKHEMIFPTVGFLIQQILRIILGSQIETKRIFSLAKILIDLRSFLLKSTNLEKLIFTMNRNWPDDPRVGCKSPSSYLTEPIEIDADLKKELEQFEGAFERDEICGHDF
jgi:hypothetical protein